MGYEIDWLVAGRVIKAEYFDELDLQTMIEIGDELVTMIDSADSPLVHVLMDTERVTQYPHQVAQLVKTANNIYRNPRIGWSIVYGREDRLMKFVMTTITGMFKVRFRIFNTQEDAFAFLNSVDQELPDLSSLQAI